VSVEARGTRSLANARATLRRVRRRLDRESERTTAFLDLVVTAPDREAGRPRVGSGPLPSRGSGEAR